MLDFVVKKVFNITRFEKIKLLIFADNHRKMRNFLSAGLYAFSLLLLDIGFRYIYRENVTLYLRGYATLFFSLIPVIILTAIGFLLPCLARRIYQIASVSVFVLLVTAQACYYSFNGSYLTFSSLIFAGEAASFFDWSYFAIPKKFILLIFVVLFISVVSALIAPKFNYSMPRIISVLLAITIAFVGLAVCQTVFFSSEGGISWDSTRTPIEIYEDFNDTRSCFHMVGLYQYTLRDISNVIGLTDLIDKMTNGDMVEQLNSYYAAKETDSDNAMTGIFKDKNLILIQLESIDTWMVNEISMPYFSALQNESINFSSFYAPKFLAASTFNTELIVNTGLVTPTNSTRLSYFTQNSYPYSMANLFKEMGYVTESYHRSVGSIYNRGDAHINWGYSSYNNGYDMNMENLDLDTDMMSAYDMFVKDEKYMSFIITYSGHGPYNSDSVEVERYYDVIRPQLPDDAEEEYVYALCHAYETDQFIKMLCERLEGDGRLEDTVLVFYADHYDHYISDENILVKYKNQSVDYNLWSELPFLIYNKGTEPMTVRKTISSFDVLPTIVNLFDLDTDGRYYIGNDAFSENGGYAFFKDYSWIEDDVYFDIHTNSPTELSMEREQEIKKRMEMGIQTVKVNYFRN